MKIYSFTDVVTKGYNTAEWIKYTDHEAEVKHLKENDLIQEEEIFKLIAENKKLRDALEECALFLETIKIKSDEDSCMGMAFVTNRISEDGYYIALNKAKEALKDGE